MKITVVFALNHNMAIVMWSNMDFAEKPSWWKFMFMVKNMKARKDVLAHSKSVQGKMQSRCYFIEVANGTW